LPAANLVTKKNGLILVVGATGNLGGMITRKLLSQGKRVRVLVRPQSNFQPLVDVGAQAVIGDLKNRASLDPACKDVEVLITTANSAKRGVDDNIETVDLDGNRNLIDAARVAKVSQFIFVSNLLADSKSPVPMMQAKGATEEYLQASGVPYTIIAPNAFMDFWIALVVGIPAVAGRPVTLVGSGDRKHSFIFSGDVARFVVLSINNPKALNQKLALGGPESISLRNAIGAFERVLGHKIIVHSVTPGQPVPDFTEPIAQLLAGLDLFDSPVDMTEVNRIFGIKLTSIDEFANDFVAHARC
jgi:uncharacterized protein YbjT (DUF2867 family)